MSLHGLVKIARRYGLESIILFGSRARGDARADSDCDICVSAPNFRGDELRLIEDMSEDLGEDVDLCIYERLGPSMMFTVATEGRRLWGSRLAFGRLRLRAIKEWQDSDRIVRAVSAYLDRQLP